MHLYGKVGKTPGFKNDLLLAEINSKTLFNVITLCYTINGILLIVCYETDYVPIGPRFSNLVLQALLVLLKKIPPHVNSNAFIYGSFMCICKCV